MAVIRSSSGVSVTGALGDGLGCLFDAQADAWRLGFGPLGGRFGLAGSLLSSVRTTCSTRITSAGPAHLRETG